MNLLEFEAKNLLAKANIVVPNGKVIQKSDEFTSPAVLKSQVPTGGRGKLGGIRIVRTKEEYEAAVNDLLLLSIKGFTPEVLLAEELLDIKSEYYLSVSIDREKSNIIVVASKNGGVEVEDSMSDSFLKLPIERQPNFDGIGQAVADWLELPAQAFVLTDVIERLVRCFTRNDATLIEINPLVLTADCKIIVADCKIILDDSAKFRHPEWSELSQQPADVNFVTLDENGTVATIANGAGLAMATIDAVHEAELIPANFLDIGGGANEASVLAAFERITQVTAVKAIVINIFAGITRCDEVAKAIISATKQITDLPPLFIRLSGTNSDIANQLLDDANIERATSLEACIMTAKQVAA